MTELLKHATTCPHPAPVLRLSWQGQPEIFCPGCGHAAPGDPVVGLHHVKQPASEIGPYQVLHDHEAGRSTIWHAADLVALASSKGSLTAAEAAEALFDSDKPTPSEREKARRKLEDLARRGLLQVVSQGNRGTATATRWGVS